MFKDNIKGDFIEKKKVDSVLNKAINFLFSDQMVRSIAERLTWTKLDKLEIS